MKRWMRPNPPRLEPKRAHPRQWPAAPIDDVHFWALCRPFLQFLMDSLEKNLAKRHLSTHPEKTKYTHTSGHPQTVRVAGQEVRGEAHGARCASGHEKRGSSHLGRGTLSRLTKQCLPDPSPQRKLQTYAKFITPAALWATPAALWAAGAAHPRQSLLKGINSLQLLQLRQALWNSGPTGINDSCATRARCWPSTPQYRWSTVMLQAVWRLRRHMVRLTKAQP